jgi:hypothetical protein
MLKNWFNSLIFYFLEVFRGPYEIKGTKVKRNVEQDFENLEPNWNNL